MTSVADSHLAALLKSALTHLYDHAYLENHPLVEVLVPSVPATGRNRSQELRKILLDAIEVLRPPKAGLDSSRVGRAYDVLFLLYVEGLDFGEAAQRLAVGERQLRRERQRALQALVRVLRESTPKYQELAENDDEYPQMPGRKAVLHELQAMQHPGEEIESNAFLAGVASTLQNLAAQHNVELEVSQAAGLPSAHGSGTVLRQAILGVLSRALPFFEGGCARFMARPGRQAISLVATLTGQPEERGAIPRLDDVLQTEIPAGQDLASSQKANLIVSSSDEPPRLQVTLELPLGHKTVLVIEDNEAVVNLFERYLAGHPYHLSWAGNQHEALRIARESHPNVILLDVMLSDCDGWELLQRLKTDPETQDIPCVVCTVVGSPELAFSLGAHAYLKKPVHQVDLLATLESV